SVLDRAGVLGLVDELFDVSATKRWKPAPEPYQDTLAKCATQPAQAVLVAAHPWDVLGAQAAGMVGGWLNRGGARWPFGADCAAVEAESLPGVAAQLTARADDYGRRRRERP